MLELDVDGTLGGREHDWLERLFERNGVDLGLIAPSETIQEGLRDVVSTLVPSCRMHLSKSMEAFGGSAVVLGELATCIERILLVGAFGIVAVRYAEVDVEKRSDAARR